MYMYPFILHVHASTCI